jgi:hypothetical protein
MTRIARHPHARVLRADTSGRWHTLIVGFIADERSGPGLATYLPDNAPLPTWGRVLRVGLHLLFWAGIAGETAGLGWLAFGGLDR